MPVKKVGVIGPTDLPLLARLIMENTRPTPAEIEQEEARVRGRAALIGRILAELGLELWVNSETRGVPFEVAKSYKENRGPKLVALVAGGREPWPPAPAGGTESFADEVRVERDWFWANYVEVSRTDAVIAAGLSPGTFSEFGYIAWDLRLAEIMDTPSSLKHLVVVKEFLQANRPEFPEERVLSLLLEKPVAPILQYIDKVEELREILQLFP
ncbi:MAG: hypothetical protein Q8O97_02935 [bacterium]|nr:hypothetical protein [Candidatus Wildermuthbacteria bacterium]MDP2664881.1 hypothetical protein [bacterium]